MITYLNPDEEAIAKIAFCLAENFARSLYHFYNERSYPLYVSIMEEIIDWSYEFYDGYHDKLHDWESFKESKENIYNAVDSDGFLVAWGYSRIKEFSVQHKMERHAGIGSHIKMQVIL